MYGFAVNLGGECAAAVISLCVKGFVIHKVVYPLVSHRVIGRAQVRFSTGLIFACECIAENSGGGRLLLERGLIWLHYEKYLWIDRGRWAFPES